LGEILSINISRKKGTVKKPVKKALIQEGIGVKDDAHAEPGPRQVSLMMWESIQKQIELIQDNKKKKPKVELSPGSYAENLTTRGIDLSSLKVGDSLLVGKKITLRVSAIGKDCHEKCAIFYKIGDCLMPREGIFCEVISGGEVRVGDRIEKS